MGWCDPTPEAITAVRRLALPVVEIGSGDGQWQRAMIAAGIDCVGCDIADGPDHRDAARNYPNHAMLAVWPPDGNEVQDWIDAADWPGIILVYASLRIRFNIRRKCINRMTLPESGRKNMHSRMEIWA